MKIVPDILLRCPAIWEFLSFCFRKTPECCCISVSWCYNKKQGSIAQPG